MKTIKSLLFLVLLGLNINVFAQASSSFFLGKWDILIVGTPNGDAKFVAEIVRKDGKLTGELKDPSGQIKEALPLTNVEEEATKVTLYFSAQGYDLNLPLEKIDDNNLKGSLMNMFETTAKRLASSDFYAGKWEILVTGTPRGDVTFKTDLVRKDGKLTGELKTTDDVRPINKVEETANKLTIFFNSSQGGEISIDFDKIDDDNLKGTLMTFDAKAKRVKE